MGSRLLIKILPVDFPKKHISIFRKLTKRPYSELIDRLRDGTLEFDHSLYGNDHDEIAEHIRSLLPRLADAGIKFRILELEGDDRPSSEKEWARAEISPQFVCNLLESHEEGLEQIKHMDSLRVGDKEAQ